MKKFSFVALAAIAALALGFGALQSTPKSHAAVTGTVVIPCEYLVSGIDGDLGDASTGGDFAAACLAAITPAEVLNLANVLGDQDGVLEASDFTVIDVDGNQVMKGGDLVAPLGIYDTTLVFAFVNNDGAVTMDAQAGLTMSGLDLSGGPNPELCVDNVANDLDCSSTILSDGDGVVIGTATVATSAAAGDTVDVTVSQADDPSADSVQTINVVGRPHNVALTALKDTVQTSGTSTDFTACKLALDFTDGANQLAEPDKTVLAAVVTDSDGTKLTRGAVTFDSASPTKANIDTGDSQASGDPLAGSPNSTSGESIDAGAAGTAAFAVLCGGTATGTAKITATIVISDIEATELDDTSNVTLTVVGAPDAIALTASPAQIACDGSQTATVTAKVTDSAGNNVADGTKVNFSVVALGTANPINGKTVGGSASSTITPLSGSTAGVTVIVTSGDASSSIRVDCSLPVPTPTSAAPAPTATPKGGAGGTIGGPDTGTGGYLGQNGSTGFPMWTLIALMLGSVALVGGSVVARRSSK